MTVPGRLDASMTLLTEVMHRPLDPGYAEAAARRAHGHRPGPVSRMLTLVVAVLCGLLATGAVAQLRGPAPEAVRARRALEGEIQRRIDHVDRTRITLDEKRRQIDRLRDQALTGAGAEGLADDVADLGRWTGELSVSGPGVQVDLSDAPRAPGAEPADGEDRGRVRDRDVQIVVNGLWAAGARAVAVNGNRLTTLSAIRAAGEAILVDLQPLLPPYRVEAVGDPEQLRARFAGDLAASYLQVLQSDGIGSRITTRQEITLSGAGATFHLQYARPVPTGAVASPSPTQEAS